MSELNLYQKLIEIRKSVPYLQKDQKVLGFKAVSSANAIGALKGKMNELGVLLVPSVDKFEVRDHKTKKGEHNYFTVLSMTFAWVNADKPEEREVCKWTGQGLDTGEKGVGKALTYAEKYFLLKFFNIATGKDDPDRFGGNDGEPKKRDEQKFISDEQRKEIQRLCTETNSNVDAFLKFAGSTGFDDILVSNYKKITNALNLKLTKK
jgi:hypothetical protein